MTDIIDLNNALKEIKIKCPMRKLLNPKFEFILNPNNTIDLSIRIDTWERDIGTEFLGLESRHPVNEHWIARFRNKPKNIVQFVKIALLRTIEHELDESIWIDNERIFEPKHWGPKDLIE